MNIFELSLENWELLTLKVNVVAVIILLVLIFVARKILRLLCRYSLKKTIQIEEMKLGIGSSSITLRYNKKEQEVAYKLWVELNTRKIGLAFEPDDVIYEIYNSWYTFFEIARELMKEIPPETLDKNENLVLLTGNVLNKGLRPHLTRWQARFRKWYEDHKSLEDYKEKAPQDIQKEYPMYDELVRDLCETNRHMIEYKNMLYNMVVKKFLN